MITCLNCGCRLEAGQAEHCWHCSGPLCGDCWEDIGHCGDQEAWRQDLELVRRVMAGELR